MKKTVVILLTMLALWGATLAQAQEITAVIEIEADPTDSLTVGDVVPVTLSVTHPAGYRLIPADLTHSWATAELPLEVGAQSAVTIADNGDGTQTSRQTITVTVWEPGQLALPPLSLSMSDPQGNLQTVTSSPAVLTVSSVLVDGDTTLRDIKPPATLPAPSVWPTATAVSVVILLVAGSAVAFVVWRKNRPQPDTRSPFQRALDDLTRIEQMNLPAQEMAQAHVTLITDVLRRYLEADFDIPALDQTTAQIVAALNAPTAPNLSPAVREQLVALLQEADLVKFANVEPDPTTAVSLGEVVRGLILDMRPAPQLDPPQATPPGSQQLTEATT